MLESGQELSARFILVRRLGAGGGGEVWLAEDLDRDAQGAGGRLVALKVLADSIAKAGLTNSGLTNNGAVIAALRRECAQIRTLDHPNILRVEGVYASAQHVWIVMEYAGGGDLTQMRGRSPAAILRAVIPIAAALAYAHRAGVVHRDVKPANVLLTADGSPRLADFGMALVSGAAPAAGAGLGSRYTMSPQQLDGEPARPADDVYGFGAMLYELLGGYPPLYPDGTLERIRGEAPAPLPASTPAPLARLVERMLAKAPDERPQMQSVERELNEALAAPSLSTTMSEETSPIRIEPPALRPQIAHGEPLKSEWRRSAGAGGSAADLRRQGFRRGVGAAAIGLGVIGVLLVFFALPRWVSDPGEASYRPAASPTVLAQPAQPAPQTQEEIDFAALARAKQQAEELRAPLQERLQKLTERAADRWGGAEYRSATAELAAGDAAYEQREYIAAAERFAKMEPLLATLEKRAGEVLKQQLQAGAGALQDGRSGDAKAAFELAMKIEPDNAAAAHGLKRAGTLDEVLALVGAAERLEKEGDANAAVASFRKALELDAQAPRAAQGVARIEAQLAGEAFASAMARGYSSLASADYSSARSAFEAARRIRPDAPEIGQALRQIEQEQRTRVIAAKLASAQELEAQERWEEALKEYRAVVELDSTVAAANEGVARTAPRASLNERLELYLTQPERLFSQPVRAAAHETLARARNIAQPGPVLQKQIATLADWIARADSPVQVALQSDNLTQVTIYRVGELGAFAQRSLELAPGVYTVVGTRPGYRDVRRRITVAPGASAGPVVIRCEERI